MRNVDLRSHYVAIASLLRSWSSLYDFTTLMLQPWYVNGTLEKIALALGLNNILFKVLLTYYDIYIHTIFLGFDGKR